MAARKTGSWLWWLVGVVVAALLVFLLWPFRNPQASLQEYCLELIRIEVARDRPGEVWDYVPESCKAESDRDPQFQERVFLVVAEQVFDRQR